VAELFLDRYCLAICIMYGRAMYGHSVWGGIPPGPLARPPLRTETNKNWCGSGISVPN
jgi:hypothetical protein